MAPKGTLRTCPKGHQYYKSSDCPTCPLCETQRAASDGILALIAAPARRALEGLGITTAAQLAKRTEKEILSLHGMGPAAMVTLRKALSKDGLSFKPASKSR